MKKNFYDKLISSSKPYIIAEIGSNHNGSIQLGNKLIKAAKTSGADCVKFQSWTPDTLYSMEMIKDIKFKQEISKYQTTKEQIRTFYRYSKKINIDFASSVFSKDEIDFIHKSIKPPFIKIASMDLNNLELITYAASTKIPIMISTGLSNLSDVDNAVRAIESMKNKKIIILHCISNYPPKDSELNLRNIETLAKIFPYPIGFSDHTIGSYAALASIAIGAKVIEKHFTTDKKLKGWDHSISADPKELKTIIEDGLKISISLGSTFIHKVEKNSKIKNFRRSCIAKSDILFGEKISSNNVVFKRPGNGIPPNKFEFIKNKIAKKKIIKGSLIQIKDLN